MFVILLEKKKKIPSVSADKDEGLQPNKVSFATGKKLVPFRVEDGMIQSSK